ncbi:glycosyltransferase family 2 protein [Leptolyngbya sp. NIES-2104]|uniref:glycosyltransferase family 2 protein n=1 Tax=Leptolyngbya sp. NIES-2104 TaxID=1552121 RepID=UPI0006ECB87F|nr:glycosyltransferase family 2 protein [Leptolyngbya sp. NIES-2104]GAP93825.1 glycosyl transferase, family 2 [Leptolyngbya sp. NIES-2104]
MSSFTKAPQHSGILPPADSRSVTVVIPCLNEEGNLELLFSSINQAFEKLGFTLPVLLVNDGSTDNSAKILAQLAQSYSFLKVVHHPRRRGVTEVWRTALSHVETDWIFWGQADLESDPKVDLPLLLEACEPGIDGVAGWRQGRGDGKVFASTFANTACRLVFGLNIHDMNWIKLVRRDILINLPIQTVTHRYLLAVLAAKGHSITETPTPWYPRYTGDSKFGKRRLATSAIDFSRVCWWFFVQRRIQEIERYGHAIAQGIKVGFQAGKKTFYLHLDREIVREP